MHRELQYINMTLGCVRGALRETPSPPIRLPKVFTAISPLSPLGLIVLKEIPKKMALRTPTIPWFALLWDFRVKIMLVELRTPEQFLCSMYLKSGKAILREQKLFFFPVKKPHSEEISSGAILGTNLSFTKGGRGVSEFCAGPSNQLRAN